MRGSFNKGLLSLKPAVHIIRKLLEFLPTLAQQTLKTERMKAFDHRSKQQTRCLSVFIILFRIVSSMFRSRCKRSLFHLVVSLFRNNVFRECSIDLIKISLLTKNCQTFFRGINTSY